MPTSELNKAQLSAVTAPLTPTLVLAGAGAGKTRVVTARILYLIEQGIAPHEILAITFTNKAAKELKERIYHKIPDSQDALPMVSTFHSLGVFILRQSIHALNKTNDFTIYDRNDSEKIIQQCLQKLNLKKTLKDHYLNQISSAKNLLLSPQDLPRKDPTLSSVYQAYQQCLAEANALDFDDLLFWTVKLFEQCPDIRKQYQEKWKALLIDEYQDTNHAQYILARYISAAHCNVFAVGDPDQSIYSWRGANISNILNFEKDFTNAKVLLLEDNYRSFGNILNAANSLIRNNTSRMKKTLRSVRGPGEKIRVFLGRTDREEAEFTAKEIHRIHHSANIPFKDFCIFYRTNFQSRTFEDALLRLRIPYKIFSGLSFYKRKEIQDILSFLRIITSKHDVVAFERSIQIPKRGIGPAAIANLIQYASQQELPLLEACEQVLINQAVKLSKKQQEGLFNYINSLSHLSTLASSLPLYEFLLKTIRTINYLEFLKQDDPDSFEDRRTNINELINKTLDWGEQNPDGSLEDFLDELTLRSSVDETSDKENSVNLMSLHNGKGLEFRVAFVVGLEEKLLPHANSQGNYENIEEERRLCYVGMTRARDLLYLTAARDRFLWGKSIRMNLSRFFKEIPGDYLIQVRL